MKQVNGRRRRTSSRRKTAREGSLLSHRRAAKSASLSTRKRSQPELELTELLMQRGYRDFVCEATFHESRKWRIDFLWPLARVGLEIEGGIFSRGRHVRPGGFIDDCEKYNAATLAGYRIYRIPVVKGWQDSAIAFVQREKLT